MVTGLILTLQPVYNVEENWINDLKSENYL